MVGIYALTQVPLRLIPFLILGAIPPAAVVMGYNYAAYHNPLTTGYGCSDKYWAGECKGIGGFTLPPAGSAIRGMSVSFDRGLFFLSPFLVLAFPGYVLWFIRSRSELTTLAVCLVIPVVFFVTIACYWGWNGGQVVGPRYLMELVPFLALPIIFVLDRMRGIVSRLPIYMLILASFLNVWIETLGGRAFPTGPTHDPLRNYSFPNLAHGQVPLNLGTFLGLNGKSSLVPLAVVLLAWSAAMLLPYLPNTRGKLTSNPATSS
jgi:hypothetical protein